MSSENRNNTAPPPPLFTVYSAGYQERVNAGFQDCHPLDLPPKYEDVISGEYLKSNDSNFNYPSPRAAAPAFQPVDPIGRHCTCSRINTAQSESFSDESEKDTTCATGCTVLVIFVIIGLFIWRLILLAH